MKRVLTVLAVACLLSLADDSSAWASVPGHATAVDKCVAGHVQLTVTAKVPAGYTVVGGTGTFDLGPSTAGGTRQVAVRRRFERYTLTTNRYAALRCS
jgi:hypothetical protein